MCTFPGLRERQSSGPQQALESVASKVEGVLEHYSPDPRSICPQRATLKPLDGALPVCQVLCKLLPTPPCGLGRM